MNLDDKAFLNALVDKIEGISCQPLPQHLGSSKWWCSLQRIKAAIAGSIIEAIHLAQKPSSGFDHRRKPTDFNRSGALVSKIVNDRYWQIADLFPQASLEELPDESIFSRQETLYL